LADSAIRAPNWRANCLAHRRCAFAVTRHRDLPRRRAGLAVGAARPVSVDIALEAGLAASVRTGTARRSSGFVKAVAAAPHNLAALLAEVRAANVTG